MEIENYICNKINEEKRKQKKKHLQALSLPKRNNQTMNLFMEY